MRPLIGLAFCCTVVALLVSSAPAAVGEAQAEQARRTLKVSIPKSGGFTVAGFVLRAQSKKGKLKKPKLGIVKKALPSGVAVLGGLLPHPTIKRAWIGSVVVLLPMSTRKTSSAGVGKKLEVSVNGDVGGVTQDIKFSWGDKPAPRIRCSSYEGFYDRFRYHPLGDVRLAHMKLAAARAKRLNASAWRSGCATPLRDQDLAELRSFLRISAAPPTPEPEPGPNCTVSQLQADGPNGIKGEFTCDVTIDGWELAPPSNFNVRTWLPVRCTCDGKRIYWSQPVPANTPTNFGLGLDQPVPAGTPFELVAVAREKRFAFEFTFP